MSQRTTASYTYPARTAAGVDKTLYLPDFSNIEFSVSAVGSADQVVKFAASNQEAQPDFASAQSATNRWDYVQVIDKQSGSAINGDTGVTFAGADVRNFEVNDNASTWVGMVVISGTTGSVSASVLCTSK